MAVLSDIDSAQAFFNLFEVFKKLSGLYKAQNSISIYDLMCTNNQRKRKKQTNKQKELKKSK